MQIESVNPQVNLQGATLPPLHDFGDLANALVQSSTAQGPIIDPNAQDNTNKVAIHAFFKEDMRYAGTNEESYFVTGSNEELENAAYQDAVQKEMDLAAQTGRPPRELSRDNFVMPSVYNLPDRKEKFIDQLIDQTAGARGNPEAEQHIRSMVDEIFVMDYYDKYTKNMDDTVTRTVQDAGMVQVNKAVSIGETELALTILDDMNSKVGVKDYDATRTQVITAGQQRVVDTSLLNTYNANKEAGLANGYMDFAGMKEQLIAQADSVVASYAGGGMDREEYITYVDERLDFMKANFDDAQAQLDAHGEQMALNYAPVVDDLFGTFTEQGHSRGIRTDAIALRDQINSRTGYQGMTREQSRTLTAQLDQIIGDGMEGDAVSKINSTIAMDDSLARYMAENISFEGIRSEMATTMIPNENGVMVPVSDTAFNSAYGVISFLSSNKEIDSLAKQAVANGADPSLVARVTKDFAAAYKASGSELSSEAFQVALLEGRLDAKELPQPDSVRDYRRSLDADRRLNYTTPAARTVAHTQFWEEGRAFSSNTLDGINLPVESAKIQQALSVRYGDEEAAKRVSVYGDTSDARIEYVSADGYYNVMMPTGPGVKHTYVPESGVEEEGFLTKVDHFIPKYAMDAKGNATNELLIGYEGESYVYTSTNIYGVKRTRLVDVEMGPNGAITNITPMDSSLELYPSSDMYDKTTDYNGRNGSISLPSGWNAEMKDHFMQIKLNSYGVGQPLSDEEILRQLDGIYKTGNIGDAGYEAMMSDEEKKEVQDLNVERIYADMTPTMQQLYPSANLTPGTPAQDGRLTRSPEEINKEIEESTERYTRRARATEQSLEILTPRGMEAFLEPTGEAGNKNAIMRELDTGLSKAVADGYVWTWNDAKRYLDRFDTLSEAEKSTILNSVNGKTPFMSEAP